MKNKIVFYVTIIIFFFNVNSCKKYDEGPWISFRSAEKRLIGEYKLTKCTIDGEDVSSYLINDSVSFEMEFENQTGYYFYIRIVVEPNMSSYDGFYLWTFQDNNKEVLLKKIEEYNDDYLCCIPPIVPFSQRENNIIKIKQLLNSEIVFELNYLDKIYRYELKE